jgi:hypothetical protein
MCRAAQGDLSLVGDCQLATVFASTVRQHATASRRTHTYTETVDLSPAAAIRLECSLRHSDTKIALRSAKTPAPLSKYQVYQRAESRSTRKRVL